MTTTHRTTFGSAIVWGGIATLLLIPAVAMQFTTEVNWDAADFIGMGIILISLGGAYEFLARKAPNWTYRAAAALALVTAFLLIWVNFAVGIIGSENNDANMMYAGVLAVVVGGACLARFRSPGMARAMVAAAATQVLVAVIALATGAGVDGAAWPRDVIGATGILTAMWLVSAWLFRRAG